jgi:hypothetical protein
VTFKTTRSKYSPLLKGRLTMFRCIEHETSACRLLFLGRFSLCCCHQYYKRWNNQPLAYRLLYLRSPGNPSPFRGRQERRSFVGGLGWAASLTSAFLLSIDEPAAPCHPGRSSTVLDPRSMCEAFVGAILMQADSLPLALLLNSQPGSQDLRRGSRFPSPSLERDGSLT